MNGKRNLLIGAMFFVWAAVQTWLVTRNMVGTEIVQMMNGQGLAAMIGAGATGTVGVVFGRGYNKKQENGGG
jgi:hypothetical protein